jgi:hypothetical protein
MVWIVQMHGDNGTQHGDNHTGCCRQQRLVLRQDVDITTPANRLVQSAYSVTNCIISGNINSNDVITWPANGF